MPTIHQICWKSSVRCPVNNDHLNISIISVDHEIIVPVQQGGISFELFDSSMQKLWSFARAFTTAITFFILIFWGMAEWSIPIIEQAYRMHIQLEIKVENGKSCSHSLSSFQDQLKHLDRVLPWKKNSNMHCHQIEHNGAAYWDLVSSALCQAVCTNRYPRMPSNPQWSHHILLTDQECVLCNQMQLDNLNQTCACAHIDISSGWYWYFLSPPNLVLASKSIFYQLRQHRCFLVCLLFQILQWSVFGPWGIRARKCRIQLSC